MAGPVDIFKKNLIEFGSGPMLEEMPPLSLENKGIAGPTAAHKIEQIHTPLNYAYTTFTTGSSAFQTPVVVTYSELEERKKAGKEALRRCGVKPGSNIVVTYPPLVNVFSNAALNEYGVNVRFILRPSRDALITAMCEGADCVIGESSFVRAAIKDAMRLGLKAFMPENLVIIAAGTPLDKDLKETAEWLKGAKVHDLYGCQEFGWLILDGSALREDIILLKDPDDPEWNHIIAGGLCTGDMVKTGKHPINSEGIICTNTAKRSEKELETLIKAASPASADTVKRAARSILRIKSKIVRVSRECTYSAKKTVVQIKDPEGNVFTTLEGPAATKLLDDLIEAQKAYQSMAKNDPVWNKNR